MTKEYDEKGNKGWPYNAFKARDHFYSHFLGV
jgi:hypothetical protein